MRPIKALLVATDGNITSLGIDRDSLEQRRDAVGGHIEGVMFDDGFGYINEEGKLLGLPVNRLATALLRGHIAHDDEIVGNLLIFGPTDINGDDTDVRDSVMERLGLLTVDVNKITAYWHCRNCFEQKPPDKSMQEWSEVQAGFMVNGGIQAWCWRCNMTVFMMEPR